MSDFLYAVGGTVGFIGLVVGATLFSASRSGQGATLSQRILSSPFASPMLIFHYFLPYGLVALVLFMDIMSQLPQGVFGFLIAFAMFLINYGIGGDPSVIPSELCEIPGLRGMASTFIPQSLLFVSTMVFYLAVFVTVSTSSQGNAQASNMTINKGVLVTPTSVSTTSPSPMTRIGATWGLALATVLFQSIGILSTPACLTNMKWPFRTTPTPIPAWGSALLAVLLGLGVGGVSGWGFARWSITQPSYTVSQQSQQIVLPGTGATSSTQAKGPGFVREQFQLGSGLGEMPMPSQGGDVPVDMAKSSGSVTPGESSDQFVCEAYKNGQLVSSTLS